MLRTLLIQLPLALKNMTLPSCVEVPAEPASIERLSIPLPVACVFAHQAPGDFAADQFGMYKPGEIVTTVEPPFGQAGEHPVTCTYCCWSRPVRAFPPSPSVEQVPAFTQTKVVPGSDESSF